MLRRVLRRYLPESLFARPKSGFGVPVGTWLRGPLRPWAEALLDPGRVRHEGYLRPEPLVAAWRGHLDHRLDLDYPLWAVLTFQAWLESTEH
jgi:asparagine synthase (glutamine-hydrolysing)